MAAQSYHNHPSAPYTPHSYGSNDPYKQPTVLVSPVSPITAPSPYGGIDHSTLQPEPFHPPAIQQKPTFRQYLESLPMFPLNTAHEAQLKQEGIDRYHGAKSAYVPSSAFSFKERATFQGLTQVMGGGNPLSAMRHTANVITQTEAMSAKFAVKENATIFLTRWAFVPPKEMQTVLVDVLEYRWGANCRPFYIKHSSAEPIKLSLLGKTGVKIKAGKQYQKELNFKDVEELGMHSEGGEVSPMVMVRREQRGISAIEWKEMRKRFEYGWNVPRV